MAYVELHAASAFSFLEGASLPEALIHRAASLGYPALALLDRDGLYGAPRFHMAAKAAGLKALVGAELTITTSASPPPRSATSRPRGVVDGPPPHPPMLWRLPVLVETQQGYRHLSRLISRMKLNAPKGEGVFTLEELAESQVSGLVALAGRAVLDGARHGVGGLLDRVVGIFGRENVYVELQRHLLRDQEADNQALVTLASAFRVPILATGGVRFATPDERPLHDVLTCIRHKTDLHRAGRRLNVNAERYLKTADMMARLFSDLPQAIAATEELSDRLTYTMANLGYRFPDYPVPPGESMISFLRKMVDVGARERYRPYHERARQQVARELDLIERLELAGYFLIVWDLVNFCRQHDILVQGRGSAANSAVCYSLGITAIDPVKMELLFERFLSEERGEWPDIDLDLPSGDRREQVIQYLYQRYGRLGAAMTANVITYRSRSAAREVGKALGIAPERIDQLAKVMNQFEFQDPRETLTRNLREIGEDPSDPSLEQFADLWRRIHHLPRHLGQHSGGMVICQGRLDEVVPLENARMPDRVVVQWDKDDCTDMGIVKVDLLGLGMMAALQDALSIVNGTGEANKAPVVDLAHLPPDDPVVYRMLQEADTVGVFQVESRAQMATLPRLKPDHFYDLVVEVAIIRPGPIVGQMVHPYLNRRAGREAVSYPHPLLEPILHRTLGVPLFQEQLLRMAMVVAGFTGGEAEELRRAMGFKRSEERMRQIETKLRAGMEKNGITGDSAEAIIRSITSFALYGFPESHAASFALLVYASAYLKAHFPAAFYTALLNNQPMGFYHPATLVKDGQRHGVRFAPIDVATSDWCCRVEPHGTVRLGLMYVRGLREAIGRAIEARDKRQTKRTDTQTVSERAKPEAPLCPKCGNDDPSLLEETKTHRGGEWFCNNCAHDWVVQGVDDPEDGRDDRRNTRFASIEELIAVTGIRRDELAVLAEIGALNAFGHDRRSALWQIERAVRPAGELFDELTEDLMSGGAGLGRLEAGPATGLKPGTTEVEDGQPAYAEATARSRQSSRDFTASDGGRPAGQAPDPSPLVPMTFEERVVADYSGTGMTIGPHPMALRRTELAMRGVLRAIDLPNSRSGRRVRVAGAVITRQRPGTAKGFVFLTLEDETGIANIIVQPRVFDAQRLVIVKEPFVIVEGLLQIQDGVTAVKAERVHPLGRSVEIESHDFH